MQKGYDASANRYIPKPFSTHLLIVKVCELRGGWLLALASAARQCFLRMWASHFNEANDLESLPRGAGQNNQR